jgi:hypothetical protein
MRPFGRWRNHGHRRGDAFVKIARRTSLVSACVRRPALSAGFYGQSPPAPSTRQARSSLAVRRRASMPHPQAAPHRRPSQSVRPVESLGALARGRSGVVRCRYRQCRRTRRKARRGRRIHLFFSRERIYANRSSTSSDCSAHETSGMFV